MMNSEIFIVDDDCSMREVFSAIFRKAGFRTAAFADGRSFVRLARDQIPACVLLDICMPGPSGLEVLNALNAESYPAPILIFSGREDVLSVVEAMRNGAFGYVEKRLEADAIVARVVDAINAWAQLRRRDEPAPSFSPGFPGLYDLTRRERDVLSQIAAAASNKETAINLGISPRTVEIHRGRIMHKLGAKNSVDLMRIVMNKGRGEPEPMASRRRRSRQKIDGASWLADVAQDA